MPVETDAGIANTGRSSLLLELDLDLEQDQDQIAVPVETGCVDGGLLVTWLLGR